MSFLRIDVICRNGRSAGNRRDAVDCIGHDLALPFQNLIYSAGAVRVSTSTTTLRPALQLAAGQRICRQGDAHRHALDDLGEIARGVFRRQQREHRAGSRRDRFDGAVDRIVVIGIDPNSDLRARRYRASCVSLKLASI